MSNINYVTEEGLKKLKEELHELKTTGRANIAKAIAEAREKGDLSENAEYDAAKEAQGLHEAKISRLESALGNSRVLKEGDVDTSKVMVLTTAEVKNLNVNKVMKFKLVAPSEADLKAGKISVESPIGKGLLGKVIGDIAEIETPGGIVKFEILSISV